jgi:hypothetical protein
MAIRFDIRNNAGRHCTSSSSPTIRPRASRVAEMAHGSSISAKSGV